MDRLPPLHALRVFEAVTRLRSFTAAAAELHLTQSAVSHQISNLEAFFGYPLLDRRKRIPAPTTAGEALFSGAQAALEVIARTIAQMRDSNGNQIRIKTYPSIGLLWLMPHLCDFYLAHPGIQVSLTTVSTESPITRWDEYDYTIEYGLGEDCGNHAELLHEESLTPLCSPALCPWIDASVEERNNREYERIICERRILFTLSLGAASRHIWSARSRVASLQHAPGFERKFRQYVAI